ncbi:MAG: RNA methyltransferase [Erysipelotrichaceae bacterium]|nr:RNA methyltransferase [Erysipelotrichaceae bacterium]
MIISGMISVKAAIENQRRDIEKVWLVTGKESRDTNYLKKICRTAGLKLIRIGPEEMKDQFGSGTGGVAAEVTQRRSDPFEKLLKQEVIFMIDGVEDPYNFGYCLRTLCAFGYKGILTGTRDYRDSEATVLRSSAGAYEKVSLYAGDDLDKKLMLLKEKGYRLYALQRSDSSGDLFKEPFTGKICLILGGEKRGIRSDILKLCDKEIFIPYGSDFRNALNLVSAVAVVSGAVYQRRNYAHFAK